MWPCRGVAEHAYCPRLSYYMTVEGIFVPSADTEQGKGMHRRVDRPSAGTPEPSEKEKRDGRKATEKLEESESDPERPRSVRSLALTSERLGLTATLDLAEINGNVAVPAEYRKGRPRRNGGGQPDGRRCHGAFRLVERRHKGTALVGLPLGLFDDRCQGWRDTSHPG